MELGGLYGRTVRPCRLGNVTKHWILYLWEHWCIRVSQIDGRARKVLTYGRFMTHGGNVCVCSMVLSLPTLGVGRGYR